MEAFAALADPTRRRIVELLAERDHDAGELAAAFTVSRPAVSRHLRVLRESGLVTVRPQAQRRVFSLDPRPLDELATWVERYRAFWSQRLDALETELARSRRQQPARQKRTQQRRTERS
jgi:DNA-binding transcriptional ArsR family regulator